MSLTLSMHIIYLLLLDTFDDSQFIPIHLFFRLNESQMKATIYSRNKQANSSALGYRRMVVLRCPLSPCGVNVCAVLIGKQRNHTLFDSNLPGRDDGTFSPGGFVVVVRPQAISSWMGNSVPLLDIPVSWRAVDPQSIPVSLLQEVSSHKTSTRLHAFVFPKVQLELLNLQVVKSNCVGALCDSLEMLPDGSNAVTTCACYHTIKRTGNVVLLMTLKVVNGKEQFIVRNFTSKKFSSLFLLNGVVPSGLSASMIQNSSFEDTLVDNVEQCFQVANKSGGFRVTGWIRRGFFVDEATASESGASRDASDRVASSDTTYHLACVETNGADISEFVSDLSLAMDERLGGRHAGGNTKKQKKAASNKKRKSQDIQSNNVLE